MDLQNGEGSVSGKAATFWLQQKRDGLTRVPVGFEMLDKRIRPRRPIRF